MRIIKRLALCVLALGAISARAARVIKVGAGQEYIITSAEPTWKVNDSVCLYDGKKELGCGIIAQKTPEKMGIKLTVVQGALRAGQTLSLRKDGRIPASTAATTTQDILPTNPKNNFDFAAGLNAGFNYFYPMVHAQMAITNDLSIGVMPMYFSSSDLNYKLSGVGGYLTVNYYYTHFPFRGLYFQGGIGLYSMDLEQSTGTTKINPLAFTTSAQWRGKAYWGIPFDIGVGAGIQYLMKDNNATVTIGFSGLLPLFTAYLGFSI